MNNHDSERELGQGPDDTAVRATVHRGPDDGPYAGPYAGPPSPADGSPSPRPGRGVLYTAIGATVLAAAGLVTAVVVGLGGGGSTHGAAPVTPVTHTVVKPVVIPVPVPADSGSGTTSGTNAGGPGDTVQPSASIKLLQEQLGRLNYYEGPTNGLDSATLHQSIEYLQRDAHLPQTGRLDAATRAALSRMLVTGNNNMAG